MSLSCPFRLKGEMPVNAKNSFKLKQAAIRMVSAQPIKSAEPLCSPEVAIRVMDQELKDYDREVVCIVNLKSDLTPINFNIVSMGTLDESLVHPREMLKSMILSNSAKVMMLHLHPSGSLTPSKDDIAITDRMHQVCSLVGVQLLDHIIIGGNNDKSYYSFMEKSVLPMETVRFAKTVDELKWDVPIAAEGTNPYQKESVLGKLQSKKMEVAKKSAKSSLKKVQNIDI